MSRIKTLRIGLDVDGVLASFSEHFLKWFNFEDQSDACDWDDPRFRDNFHKIMKDENFWLTVPRMLNPKLLKFTPIMYVTAREIETEVTKKWLDQNNFPNAEVITVGHNRSKVQALKGQVDVYVDDAYHNYIELNRNGINCKLITRSHNVKFDVGEDRYEDLLDFQKRYLNDYTSRIINSD